MSVKSVENIEEFKSVLETNQQFFLLKHSLTCPVSAEAKRVFEDVEKEIEIPLYILRVQDSRSLSNVIADEFQIKHESPQVLLFNNKQVVWSVSHWNITKDALQSASSQIQAKWQILMVLIRFDKVIMFVAQHRTD